MGMSGSVCTSVSLFWHLYVCWYIWTLSIYLCCPYVCGYICTSVCPSVHPWDTQQGHLYVRHYCACEYICFSIHPLSVRSCKTVGLSYQLIIIIVGHMHCHVRLALVPSVLWVIILVQCFCLLDLGANRCLLRLCTVDTVSSCRHLSLWFIFFCSVFIMSQPTATTTTSLVMVMCASASSLTMTVTMAPTS